MKMIFWREPYCPYRQTQSEAISGAVSNGTPVPAAVEQAKALSTTVAPAPAPCGGTWFYWLLAAAAFAGLARRKA